MKTLKYFVLFIMLTASVVTETGNLKGKITDAKTGEPLVGANVVVLNQNCGAASDINGEYEIKNIPVGTYSVKISYVGYKPKIVHDVIIESGRTNLLNAKLETDFVLNEITIIEKKPQFEKSSINACMIMIDGKSPHSQAGGYSCGISSNWPSTEEYNKINDNIFKDVKLNPLSTFSADVDYGCTAMQEDFCFKANFLRKML